MAVERYQGDFDQCLINEVANFADEADMVVVEGPDYRPLIKTGFTVAGGLIGGAVGGRIGLLVGSFLGGATAAIFNGARNVGEIIRKGLSTELRQELIRIILDVCDYAFTWAETRIKMRLPQYKGLILNAVAIFLSSNLQLQTEMRY